MKELHERAEQQARQLSELDELNREAWNARLDGIAELHENDKAWAKALGKRPLEEPSWSVGGCLLVLLGVACLAVLTWKITSPWPALLFFPAIIAFLFWWFHKRSQRKDVAIKSFVEAWRPHATSMGLQPSYESQLYQKACHDCKDLKPFKGAETELIELKGSGEMLQTLSEASAIYDVVSGNLEGFPIEVFDAVKVGAYSKPTGSSEWSDTDHGYRTTYTTVYDAYTRTFLVAACPESAPYIRIEPHPSGRWQRFFGGAIKVNPEFDHSFRVYASSAPDVDSILQPEVINHLLRHREQQLYIEVTNGLAALCHRGFLYKSQLPYLMETASVFLRAILSYAGREPDGITKTCPDVTDQAGIPKDDMRMVIQRQESLTTPKKEDKLRPSRNIELNLPYDEAFDLCISSLNTIKKCDIRLQDRTQGKIYARSGMTMMSFGEIVSFDIGKIDNNKMRVKISSRPAADYVVGDWGKNRKNVESIIGFLKERNSM